MNKTCNFYYTLITKTDEYSKFVPKMFNFKLHVKCEISALLRIMGRVLIFDTVSIIVITVNYLTIITIKLKYQSLNLIKLHKITLPYVRS
jgi:hypothetical protein